MKLKRRLIIGVLIIFILFYFITSYLLDKRNVNKDVVVDTNKNSVVEDNNDDEIKIVNDIYSNFRILYDVVNNKFKVNQDDVIQIGDITYKKIINFDEVMNDIFTSNGILKYIEDMGNYFAYTDDGYYLAGNLVSYQTYYFRGDSTNIYILDSNDSMIDAIIYEKWTSNSKNTLARVKIVLENDKWLLDDVNLLATE